jgi:hypothetical protein
VDADCFTNDHGDVDATAHGDANRHADLSGRAADVYADGDSGAVRE